MRAINVLILLLALCFAAACSSLRGNGGGSTTSTSTGTTATTKQPQDPKESANSLVTSEQNDSLVYPAGTIIEEEKVSIHELNGKLVTTTNKTRAVLSQDTPRTKTVKESAETKIGGAQKNTIGETVASIREYRWMQVIGVAVFLFGILSLGWPPLKLIIGSVTTSLLIAAGGVALIILPPLFVQHGVLILGIVTAVCGIWFFAHRYSKKDTEAKIYKDFIDKNKDGIDDRTEKTKT